jgi:hypothetical protein
MAAMPLVMFQSGELESVTKYCINAVGPRRPRSVFRGPLNVIDDQKFERSFLGFQLQAQLLL